MKEGKRMDRGGKVGRRRMGMCRRGEMDWATNG